MKLFRAWSVRISPPSNGSADIGISLKSALFFISTHLGLSALGHRALLGLNALKVLF